MSGLLLINPRAGNGGVSTADLVAAAERNGITTHVLAPGDDAAQLAAQADQDTLGIAGGDGSLAAVAGVAVERERAFVCIPFGTRNHFARDVGLDRDDPLSALEAFDGPERRVDVGRAGDRLFLNNISLGLYADLVHRREHHRRRRDALAGARAAWRLARGRRTLGLTVDGRPVEARVVLVANNAYELKLFDVGARTSLDEGALHLYIAEGWLPRAWHESRGEHFRLDASQQAFRAAVDGEPARLALPLDVRVQPGALRLRVPARE